MRPTRSGRHGPSNYQFTNLPIYQFTCLDPAFTMIELAIVMSIIIILAAMGMAQYRNAHIRAAEAVLKEDLFQMRDAMDQYYADKNKWPTALDELVRSEERRVGKEC